MDQEQRFRIGDRSELNRALLDAADHGRTKTRLVLAGVESRKAGAHLDLNPTLAKRAIARPHHIYEVAALDGTQLAPVQHPEIPASRAPDWIGLHDAHWLIFWTRAQNSLRGAAP